MHVKPERDGLAALQIWIGAICLLLCLGADGWTFLYRRGEFLASLGFTLLVIMIQVLTRSRRKA